MTLINDELNAEIKSKVKTIGQELTVDGKINSQMTLADIVQTVLAAGELFQAASTGDCQLS